MAYEFDAVVWRWPGDGGWHFATLPIDISDEIDELTADSKKGFGSVPVRVTIGVTSWSTSVFPSKEAEAYVLPVKQQVRRAEGLTDGTTARFRVELAAR